MRLVSTYGRAPPLDRKPSGLGPDRLIRSWLPAFGGIFIVLGGVFAWALISHGSLRNAWLYSQGKRVLIDDPLLVVPSERQVHAASLTIRNLSSAPVQILGTDKGCDCIKSESFPVDIPPNGSRPIRLTVDLTHLAGDELNQALVLHTSHPVNPRLTATIRTVAPVAPDTTKD